jgi:hypothetical protein
LGVGAVSVGFNTVGESVGGVEGVDRLGRSHWLKLVEVKIRFYLVEVGVLNHG